jgi:hypothetical protein
MCTLHRFWVHEIVLLCEAKPVQAVRSVYMDIIQSCCSNVSGSRTPKFNTAIPVAAIVHDLALILTSHLSKFPVIISDCRTRVFGLLVECTHSQLPTITRSHRLRAPHAMVTGTRWGYLHEGNLAIWCGLVLDTSVRPSKGRNTWCYEVSGLHVVRRYDIVTLRFSSVPTGRVGTVPQIRSWSFPLASFPTHYSLIILLFHAVWSPSLTALLNKPLITEANVSASM